MITVHERVVAVVYPLSKVAIRVFEAGPAVKSDEGTDKNDPPDNGAPFRFQEIAQPASLGTIPNEFDVVGANATFEELVEGRLDVTVHPEITFTVHKQLELSKPS